MSQHKKSQIKQKNKLKVHRIKEILISDGIEEINE